VVAAAAIVRTKFLPFSAASFACFFRSVYFFSITKSVELCFCYLSNKQSAVQIMRRGRPVWGKLRAFVKLAPFIDNPERRDLSSDHMGLTHVRPVRFNARWADSFERELREIAGRMGCEIVRVYKDHGISGTRGRDKRPAFDKLCRDAARREFDVVMAWSVDRLGRSLQDLVGFLSELHALKIDLFLRQQGLDTTTPAGKAMFQMMGVFAEFERAMIAERVRAGLARARGERKRLGRPPIAPALEKRIREALATPGTPGVCVIAKQFGVNAGTVQRISRPFEQEGVAL
jgi:DNA invertase Pin-like site-specific DNA recombinase